MLVNYIHLAAEVIDAAVAQVLVLGGDVYPTRVYRLPIIEDLKKQQVWPQNKLLRCSVYPYV